MTNKVTVVLQGLFETFFETSKSRFLVCVFQFKLKSMDINTETPLFLSSFFIAVLPRTSMQTAAAKSWKK